MSLGDLVDPASTGSPTVLTKDQFLKHKVALIEGNTYTVRDIIDYSANAAGGVHHTAKSNLLKRMAEQANIASINGTSIFLRLVSSIGKCVVHGLSSSEIAIATAMGNELREQGAFAAAESFLRRAHSILEPYSEHFPDHYAAVSKCLCLCLHDQGRYREELTLWEKIYPLFSTHFESGIILSSMNDYGACLRENEKLQEAEELLKTAIRMHALDRDGLDLLFVLVGNLAHCYVQVGDLDKALEALWPVVEVDDSRDPAMPERVGFYLNLSQIYFLKQEYEAAEHFALRATSISLDRYIPLQSRVWHLLSLSLARQGRLDEEAQVIQTELALASFAPCPDEKLISNIEMRMKENEAQRASAPDGAGPPNC